MKGRGASNRHVVGVWGVPVVDWWQLIGNSCVDTDLMVQACSHAAAPVRTTWNRWGRTKNMNAGEYKGHS